MSEKIEFAVFCIENIAKYLNMNAASVYKSLTDKNNILHTYILPNYSVLHTQGKNYIVDDIIGVMRERGVLT